MFRTCHLSFAILSLALLSAGSGCDGDSIPTGGDQQTVPDAMFVLSISSVDSVIQGTHVHVDVSVELAQNCMNGFDLRMAFDASALSFQAADLGAVSDCGWEYFSFKFAGECGDGAPSGLLQLLGIAEISNGPFTPDRDCIDNLITPWSLVILDFLVTDDRTFECQWVPIEFFWCNCADNTIAYNDGGGSSLPGVSRHVLCVDTLGGQIRIDNDTIGFPTSAGAQDICVNGLGAPWSPLRAVDFINGGISIVCSDSIDARWPMGDINLNNIAYETADAVLFSNYFVYGLDVFTIHREIQIRNTDVNEDGTPLTVEDLMYMIRVIVGDAIPYTRLSVDTATVVVHQDILSVDKPMGAAFIVAQGDVTPILLADQVHMQYNCDGQNTRILVSSMEANEVFEGDFIRVPNVVSVELSTYEGDKVVVQWSGE
ncbi:MAG: hypothetical protein ABIE70_01025 [bacterium]